MVKQHEVKTYIERLYCDKCGAEMECVTRQCAPAYRYVCPDCGAQVTMYEYYPQEVKEEVGHG